MKSFFYWCNKWHEHLFKYYKFHLRFFIYFYITECITLLLHSIAVWNNNLCTFKLIFHLIPNKSNIGVRKTPSNRTHWSIDRIVYERWQNNRNRRISLKFQKSKKYFMKIFILGYTIFANLYFNNTNNE